MRDITELERAEIQTMTDAIAKTFKTRNKKADGASDFADFADFNKAAKAESSLFDIKRIVARHSVKDSIKQYLLQRNEVIKSNKDKAKLKQKEKENKHVSHPNWY
jgi:hypothetical protein